MSTRTNEEKCTRENVQVKKTKKQNAMETMLHDG